MPRVVWNNLNRPGVLSVLLLCVAVVALSGSVGQAVEFAGGTGAPAAPYQIATAEQLAAIGDDPNLLDKYFILVNDIDLDPNLPGGRVFTQAVIAYEADVYRAARIAYTGRFYGDGHTIRHLTIDGAGMQYFGLFGIIGSTGRVYDLVLEDIYITSAERAGGLAGLNKGGLVNCSVSGRIRGPDRSSWLGGLAGANDGTITQCRSTVTVTGGDGSLMLGGVVGIHRGGVSHCSATGDVRGARGSFYLGGLVGVSVGGVLRDNRTTGCVVGGDASWGLGALAGRVDSASDVANCSATGTVTAGAKAHDLGGLIGSCYGADIAHCYAIGNVAGGDTSYRAGGLLGSCLAVTVSDCYAIGDVRGYRALGGFVGCVQAATSITNCHAVGKVLRDDRPWGRGGFAGTVEEPADVCIAGCFWNVQTSGATLSAAGVGLTSAQMRAASTFQAARWDLAGDASDGTADLWLVPEGGPYPVLAAFSDSNEPHVLEGSGASFDPYLIATAADLGAMARYRRSAWFRLVADIDLTGVTWTTAPIAALTGFFDGHGHCIRNLTIKGEKGSDLGLFGRLEAGAWVYDLGLEDIAIVVPDGSCLAGGLAGENAGYVVDCYVTGTIMAGRDCRSVGGMVGGNWLGVVSDCYTAVAVQAAEGSTQIGGLVGYDYMGTLGSCYAAGKVSGSHREWLGALVGRSSEHARTYSCCYLASSDGGGPDQGAGEAVTAEQLRQASTFVDWDFKTTWMLCEGESFPHLQWEGRTCGP